MKKTSHRPNQQYLLRSIVSDLQSANSDMGVDEILSLIPDAIEELLPKILFGIRLSKRTFSPYEFRLREMRIHRKRGMLQERFEHLEESDPELIISASRAALNEITDSASVYYGTHHLTNSNVLPIEYNVQNEMMYAARSSITETESYHIARKYDISKEIVTPIRKTKFKTASFSLEEEISRPNQGLPKIHTLHGVLQKVQAKTSASEFLAIEDMLDIDHLTKSRKLEPSEISLTNKILSDDIKRRNDKYDCDCVDELYKNSEIIPISQRLTKPNKNDKIAKIKEGVRAIILDEYVRFKKIKNAEFLDGKINYDEYQEKITQYVRQVAEAWPSG
ncbi:MAG: hypothetical protein KGI28_02295 [Thaumarchaeota archaeon]|nr:hypothetical protein [Nitrososphaerota archaeon]